jgi:MFS family permease
VADPGPASSPLTEHDRRRLALTWRVVIAGVVLGALGAVWVGLAGAPGAAGFAMLVIGAALGSGAAALLGAVLAVVDELRGAPVARRRMIVSGVLFASSLLLLTLGVAGGA